MGITSPPRFELDSLIIGATGDAAAAGAAMPPSISAVESPPFPFDGVLIADVGAALEAAVRRNDAATARLRMAIERCAIALRDQGMSAEHVLLTMKAFVRHSATEHPPVGMPAERWAADAWMGDIVHWSLLEYFRSE